jgi:lathosterol oxidase
MIYVWLQDQLGWAGLVAATAGFGFLFYALVAGASYHYFFRRHRERYVPDYQPKPRWLKRACTLSAWNILGNTLLILPVQVLIVTGHSRLYTDVAERGVPYLLLSALGALLFAETAIYWLHRMLHLRPLFRLLHAPHHRFREPNPLIAYAFHPVDSFTQSLPYHIYVFLVPTCFWVYFPLFIFSSFWTVLIHDRVRWVPGWLLPLVNYGGCHITHHWFGHSNYGNYFTLWDRLCGTYLSPAELPDKFFAVKPPPRLAAEPAPAT